MNNPPGSKQEWIKQQKNLFRLIDSYQIANIDLALSLIQKNKLLKEACKVRYYPLIRSFDSNMGHGLRTLKKIAQSDLPVSNRLAALNRTQLLLFKHYCMLGELDEIAHLGLMEKVIEHFTYDFCEDIFWINKNLKKGTWPNKVIRRIRTPTRPKFPTLKLPKEGIYFDELLELNLFFTDNLSQFLPYFAQMQKLQKLDLRSCKIKDFPIEITTLSNLRDLQLSHNHFTSFPDDIQNLKKLRRLNLEQTGLLTFPESIKKLKQLHTIYALDSPITHLPESIGSLTKLKTLDLRKTMLTAIPESIRLLKHLKVLDIRRTKIKKDSRQVLQLKDWLPNCDILVGNWGTTDRMYWDNATYKS